MSVRHGGLGRWTVVGAVLAALIALLVPGTVAQAASVGPYHPKTKVWKPKKLPSTPEVGSHPLMQRQVLDQAVAAPLKRYQEVKPAWPAAATRTVSLSSASTTAAATEPVRAQGLPVEVARLGRTKKNRHATTARAVRVRMASHSQAQRLGVNGMLFGVTRADGKADADHVKVVIDYSSLAEAYGGGYGSRLTVERLPGCALTAPATTACRQATPVTFTNDTSTQQLTADVPLTATPDIAPLSLTAARSNVMAPMALAADTTTLAVTSTTGGSQGNYAATSLKPSGTWQTSGTGAFTYSYPIDTPQALGGNAPSVALDYDSQSVDGETSARNSQASWIGDGWDYQPGFVERTYRGCGSLLDDDGNKILKGSGDECWGGDNATISFGSHSGVLVPDGTDSDVPHEIKQWRLQGDDGTLVQELSGADNGLYQGTYFRVLTTDGTAAYFGADHSPTAAGTAGVMQSDAKDDSTHSAWGVPVLHPQKSDPCYDSDKGKASQCSDPEGWRWNLDFVVSPSGFVQRYDYSTEKNYYDLGGGQAASGDTGTLTSYTRGGTLESIAYGYTLDDEQAGRTPAAEVDFSSEQRCQTTSSFTDCSAGNLTDSTAPHWPDVPWDLHCDSTDKTKLPDDATTVPEDVCITTGPTFWNTSRLDTITTKVHVKNSSDDKLVPVDSYQLNQTFSDAGGSVDPVTGSSVDPKDAGSLQAVMWLQTIQHTGEDTYGNGNDPITLNKVAFTGTEIDNRVNDDEPAAPPLYRPRIAWIQTETGESIAVDYNETPCAGKTLTTSDADSNSNSCYPAYWSLPGASKPIADWFNKVTVHQVDVSDLTIASQDNPPSSPSPVGSEDQLSTYSYSGAAWHRDDSEQTDDQYRTWDQFRGFRTVTVETGQAPEPVTKQVTTYLQGMDGDYKADGTRRSVNVDAKVGGNTVETVQDVDQLAGTPLEQDTYTSADGSINAESVNGPFTYTTTASDGQSPWTSWTQEDNPGGSKPTLSTLPDIIAYRVESSKARSYTLLANGAWREASSDTTYDSEGRPVSVDAQGDVSDAHQETCVSTGYATPPSTNTMMLTYPDQATRISGPCGGKVDSSSLISDTRTYYGGSLASLGTFGQVSATGQATGVRVATGFADDGTENWRTTVKTQYDSAGRVTDSADASGQVTHTDFTPSWSDAGGNTNPTGTETTNSQGWTVSSVLDPLRGVSVKDIDANSRETDTTYDALGRRTAVWLPGRDKASQTANMTFAYSIDPGAQAAPGGTITQPGNPTAVTTKTLREDETYSTSVTIYDGMLQPRQTQETADGDSDSGRIISDTFYDSHGWPTIAYAPYSEPNNGPSTTLYAANENQIPSETTTAYDGEGRTTSSTLWHNAIKQWSTTTSYPGADETVSTPPAGGATTETFTNGLGQTTRSVVKDTDTTTTLKGGQVIPSGTSLTSDSVRLTMQANGDLVLTSLTTGAQIWHSGTSGNAGAYAKFGTDGNLGVYTTSGTSKWTTGLTATTGATFQVRNDSTIAVIGSNGTTSLWHQGTANAVPSADATTTYSYTPAGQTSSVQDTAGDTWSYKYNLLGQLTSQTDPDVGTTTYDQYDVMGNLQQTTDPRGQVLSYHYDWDNRPVSEYGEAWKSSPTASKELASYTYDSLAKGYPTSQTRYTTDATKQYTEAVTGYNTAYQPLGSTLTIPASDGFAAAGQSSPPASGSVAYTMSAKYTPNIGLLSETDYQADGGLPNEDIYYGYNLQGELDSFGSLITPTNTPSYLDTAVHDAFGRVAEANYGNYGKELVSYAQYDATTGAVTQNSSMLQTSTTALDVINYRYNQAGEITAVDDLQNNTTHDTQCFTYDSFQRLTAAWTDTAGITDPGTATPGAIGGCTTSSVQTTGAAPKTTTVGGPAPYWQTYTYDLLGDRTGMVNHDTGGNALNDTTQSTTYGTTASGTTTVPNQANATTTSNPSVGTATETPTYNDPNATPSGANAGDTTSRTNTYEGHLVTGFALSGGGTLCVGDLNSSTTAGNHIDIEKCGTATGQDFKIGTDGNIKVMGLCMDVVGNATTAGSRVDIDNCKTDPTQKWKVTSKGTIVNQAAPTLCLTDTGATTTTGTQLTLATCGSKGGVWLATGNTALPLGQTQTFTYDAEGRTGSVTSTVATGSSPIATSTSSYLYDASGNLLEQTDSSDTTHKTRVLYLFGGAEQLTLDTVTGTCTALRYYAGPDGTTVVRSSSGAVAYELSNAQGTSTTAVDASTLAVTRRYYDPYGNPRGTTPTTWVSSDENHGFLGQPADATNGLDLLGARVYDPTLGRFLTPDPIFEAGDPNQMGGYTYAGDNPASGSDPTGLSEIIVSSSDANAAVIAADADAAPDMSGGPTEDERRVTAIGNSISGTIDLLDRQNTKDSLFSTSKYWHSWTERHWGTQDFMEKPYDWATDITFMAIPDIGEEEAAGAAASAMARAVKLASRIVSRDEGAGAAASAGEEAAEEAAGNGLAHADAEQKSEEVREASEAPEAPEKDAPSTKKASGEQADRPHDSAGSGTGSQASDSAAPRCSFSPDTPVLMAKGKTKPIGKIKPGDKVESADQSNGKHKGLRKVLARWINHDHDLLDLKVRTSPGHTAVLHTTSNHPFWDADTHSWVPAGKLKPGTALNTADGHHTHVVSATPTPGAANRYNLTVQELHTYYVMAGTTPILVHNSCGPDSSADNYTPGGHAVTHGPTGTAVGSDTQTMNNFNNVANEGLHDVVAHGTRDGYVSLDGELTNGGQLVEAIRSNPNYLEGQACRLMVCHSGVSGVGQQVADELGVPVLAPSDRVGTIPALGPGQTPIIDNEGFWQWLYPQGG